MKPLAMSRRSAQILFALVVLALLLDFLFFTGYYASDDRHYIAGARAIAGDGTFIPELGNVRLGITLPSAFVFWVTKSVAAIVWFHVVYHLGLVVLAYVLGRMLHEERTGLWAAAFVATSPLLYVYAGAVLPDNANAFWLVGSTIALLVMRRGADERIAARRRFIGYFASGVMLGLAYTCKEATLIMCLPAAVFTMTAGPPLRRLEWIRDGAMIILGLVVVLVADYVVLRLVTGQWISRLTMVSNHADEFRESMMYQGTTPFARFATGAKSMRAVMPITVIVLMAGAVAYGFVRAKRSLGLMVTFWWPLIYLTIGPTSLGEYIPPVIQARYYAVLIVPVAVMTAAAAGALVDRWRERNRWLPRVVVVLAVLVMVKEIWHNLPNAGTIYRANEAKAFVTALEEIHERYPTFPVVLSKYYASRMQRGMPLRVQHIVPGPIPDATYPYLYVTRALDVDDILPALDTPTHEAKRVFETFPPASRGAVIVNAVRHMFSVEPQRPVRTTRDSSAVVILVSPRVSPPPVAPQ